MSIPALHNILVSGFNKGSRKISSDFQGIL
jgi:hypothetical protein